MMARFEQTTDDREYYDCEDGYHDTAPGVEGGNDGLHGDKSIMGEAVDKEDGSGPEEVLVWSVGPGCQIVKIVRKALGLLRR